MSQDRGRVYLVGAGPGDPGLITVRGLDILRKADVVIHDRLCGDELLHEAPDGAEIIDVGKEPGCHTIPQEQIDELLVARAGTGACVVRLKGGDPFVFGRGFEELTACRAAGIECTVIPGVSSAFAAPGAVGIPVTTRNLVRSLAVITGRTAPGAPAPPLDYRALARMDTICVLMGRAKLREIAASLIAAGRAAATPAACIEWATTPQERVVLGTLHDIADQVDRAGLTAPVVTVIGDVAAFADPAAQPGCIDNQQGRRTRHSDS